MRHIASVVLAILVMGTVPATAQRLAPGTHVRITTPGVAPWTARVVAHDDTLMVRSDDGGAVEPVLLSSTLGLEVRRGRVRHPFLGAGIGLVVGAVAGAVLGPADDYTPSSTCNFMCTRQADAMYGAAILGAGGLVVGAVIGAIGRARWEKVGGATTHASHVRLAPAGRGGVAMGVSLDF